MKIGTGSRALGRIVPSLCGVFGRVGIGYNPNGTILIGKIMINQQFLMFVQQLSGKPRYFRAPLPSSLACRSGDDDCRVCRGAVSEKSACGHRDPEKIHKGLNAMCLSRLQCCRVADLGQDLFFSSFVVVL